MNIDYRRSSARIDPRTIGRRRLLVAAAGFACAGTAGCLGDDGDEPLEVTDPVGLGGATCDSCGMMIDEHHGPAGQAFYADADDAPATFDSIDCLRSYHERASAEGRERRDTYVTDYSSVQFELLERDGQTYVSTHVDAAAFADATELQYVVGAVHGAMGEAAVPFSDQGEAESFAEDHDGEIRSWDGLH